MLLSQPEEEDEYVPRASAATLINAIKEINDPENPEVLTKGPNCNNLIVQRELINKSNTLNFSVPEGTKPEDSDIKKNF